MNKSIFKTIAEGTLWQGPSIIIPRKFINFTNTYKTGTVENEIIAIVENSYEDNSFGRCYYERFFIYCRSGIITNETDNRIKISRQYDRLGHHVVLFNPDLIKDGRLISAPSRWEIEIN